MTLVAAPSTFSTAPVPRPPQPMTPTRIGSSGAAWLVVTKGSSVTAAAPAMANEEFFRNCRRGKVGGDFHWGGGAVFISRGFVTNAFIWKGRLLPRAPEGGQENIFKIPILLCAAHHG